ncbi:type II toxin-antitoxin system HicB family antitoxin [Oceanospirillum maris]|uniref:type II toxin-antitoxin system HicB family antitoxin n=1 Tax=Oceanospirillum maris TaxID=64977 RepID=UPI000A04B981|nr:type II toxin-antitoxin system HicB family antitoxin [Oceanospirillum maris]
MMKHKGYLGSVEFDLNQQLLHGKIEAVNDLVTYEAKDIAGLKAAFEEAVDDYLATCEEQGKAPDKSMNGSFNIRIGEELHKKACLRSLEKGCSINDVIKQSVAYYLGDNVKSEQLKISDDYLLNMATINTVETGSDAMRISMTGGYEFIWVYIGTGVSDGQHIYVEVNEFHRIKRQIGEYLDRKGR